MNLEKKICLFNPIQCVSYPPLNLTFLASYLLKYGKHQYNIKLVDINFSSNSIDEIIKFSPDIIGFTSLSPYMLDIYDLCKKLKDKRKDILAICGGVHATINPAEVLENGFDVAVVGEGEKTFQELVDVYIEKSENFNCEIFNSIDGLAFRNNKGEFIKTRERDLIVDLDLIPHPARFLLNNSAYHKRYYITRGMSTYGIHTLHGSRGCPFQCIFCCVNFTVQSKVRLHSPEYIADEVDILVQKHKAKWIFFTDDTFFIDKYHTEKLCKLLIKKGLHKKVKWEVQIRSNLIKENDFKLLELMKEAGCSQIDFGFESANQRVLTLIKGGGITVQDHKRAIDLTKKAGLGVMGTFILATPSETHQEMMDTVKFIKNNFDNIDRFQVGCMIPYPGTRVYEMAVKSGIIKDDYLKLLKEERKYKKEQGAVVFSDTISEKDVLGIRMELDNLSMKKIGILDKLQWLLYNTFHNPKIAINGFKWTIERLFKYIFRKRSVSQ